MSQAIQEQKNSNCIEALPNEVLLKIFQSLTILDLGKCAQVSKKFRIIAYDSTLWQKVWQFIIRVLTTVWVHSTKGKS